jgi:hypothetical protein
MKLNIIHLPERTDRLIILERELIIQGIKDYQIWKAQKEPNPITAISKAHKSIVRHAIALNLPSVLIAEDDVHFTAPGAFDHFLRNRPEDFDLYLGGIIYGKINAEHRVFDFSGTMFYMIHQRFYKTFLSTPENQHLDRAQANRGEFVVCYPMVAVQHNGFSDNSKRFFDYEPYLRDKELFSGMPYQ